MFFLTNLFDCVTIRHNQREGIRHMDLETAVVKAIEDGGECFEDVLAHVKTNFSANVDELHVADMVSEFWEDKMSEGYA